MRACAAFLAALVLAWLAPTSSYAQGYEPDVAAAKMIVPNGLAVNLYAAEPNVRQPILLKPDDRGRIWTVQYLQYPNPAGLTRVKVDRYSRTVYDRVPEPPPKGPRGADRITICEDTDGDGRADPFKDFVDGLNLCTGLEFARDGVYILQAPYLLFYPDRNRDDVPDGDPEVVLAGFGLEDAQSLVNHLTWGRAITESCVRGDEEGGVPFGVSQDHQPAEVAEEYAAVDQSTTLPGPGPSGPVDDPLTEILRKGARDSLAQAIEAEVAAYLQERAHLQDEAGRRQVVRDGYLPAREVLAGLVPVEVHQPRFRDRRPRGERETFASAILPPYLRKAGSLEELPPRLYLEGVGAGDFSEALRALLGPDAPGLSATTVTRLKAAWEAEYDAWAKRPLAGRRYVYVWADGVHFNIRLEADRQCILVLMGATADGRKELIAVADGYRESEQSWKELLLDVKARGLEVEPSLAIGDGALGFWKAVRQVRPSTKGQRCWAHKTADVLGKLPKGVQPRAKRALREIYEAEGRKAAEKAFDLFVSTYEAKSPRAVECLSKDRETLLTSFDFPAEHRRHVRTTNPIESTFATVRLRHDKTKGSGSRTACLTMVFKLMESASKCWRLLNGSPRLGDVVRGVKFVDGVEAKDAA